MTRRALQVVLTLLGVVAVTFGMLSIVTGAASLPAAGEYSATVDSELRFYAAWYVGAGAVILAVAREPGRHTVLIRGVCGALWLGAAGRLLSLLTVGRPHTISVVLMVIEFAIPLVIVPWHARVTRAR